MLLLRYVVFFILVLLAGPSLGVVSPHQSLPDCDDQQGTICFVQRSKLLALSERLVRDNTDMKRWFDGLVKLISKQNEVIEYLKQDNSRLHQENHNVLKVNHKMQEDQRVLHDLYHLTQHQLNYTMERYAEKVMEKASLETYYMSELSKCTTEAARKQEGDTTAAAVMDEVHQQTADGTNRSLQRYVTPTPQTCPRTTHAQTMPELELRRKHDAAPHATTNVPDIVATPEIIMETGATDSKQTATATTTAVGHLLVNTPQTTTKTSTERGLSTHTAPSSQEMPTLILETMTGKATVRNKEVLPLLETSLMVVPLTNTMVSREVLHPQVTVTRHNPPVIGMKTVTNRIPAHLTTVAGGITKRSHKQVLGMVPIQAGMIKMVPIQSGMTKMVPKQAGMTRMVPGQTAMTKLVPKTLPLMTSMVRENKALVSRTAPKTAFPGTPMTGILPRRFPGMMIAPSLPVQTNKRIPKTIPVNTELMPGKHMTGRIPRRIPEMSGLTLPVEMIETVPMESQTGMVPQQTLSTLPPPPPPPPQTESSAAATEEEGVSDNFIAEICAGDGVFCEQVSEELTELNDSLLEEMKHKDNNNALSQT